MNALTTFDFEGEPVRFVTLDGREAAVGKDACRCLGIANTTQAVGRIPDDEKGVCTTATLGGPQEMVVLFEPGLYRLIFESRKAEAERFKRWVFHEVLPAIRKTGAYGRPLLSAEETAAALSLVREARLTHGKARAAALWPLLGLPDIPQEPAAPRRQPDGVHQEKLLETIDDFLGDCAERDHAAKVQARRLYEAYRRWAGITSAPAMSETLFGRLMTMTGFGKEDGRIRYYHGLRLKAEVLRKLS